MKVLKITNLKQQAQLIFIMWQSGYNWVYTFFNEFTYNLFNHIEENQ